MDAEQRAEELYKSLYGVDYVSLPSNHRGNLEKIQAAIEAACAEALVERDRLWCESLARTLKADSIAKVTGRFNESRDDSPPKKTGA